MTILSLDDHMDRLLDMVDETLPKDKQSYFTKKIISELRETREAGKSVAQHDVSQLKHYYGQDLLSLQRQQPSPIV